MKVLGQPIFFIIWRFSLLKGKKTIEEYANSMLEKFHYERFFTIGGVHYRRFHCSKMKGCKGLT